MRLLAVTRSTARGARNTPPRCVVVDDDDVVVVDDDDDDDDDDVDTYRTHACVGCADSPPA